MASNAINVLTGGLTDQPDWTPANLDPNTAALIDQMNQQGGQSQQDLINRQLQGTSATMAPATGGAVSQQQAALGDSDNGAVTQALNDRANRLYESQYAQLHSAAAANAPAEQGRLMSQGANALEQQQKINDELNRQQMQVTLQKWGMRNQIIGQLLSGAGSFAGTYAGMQGGRGANPELDQTMGDLNNTNLTHSSDPNSPYNLTGDLPNSPDYMGMNANPSNNFNAGPTGRPYGNGYFNQPNQPPSGYGLGVSFNGSG